MAVRSGLIDEWDALDDFIDMMGPCPGVTKALAEELVPKLRYLLKSGIPKERIHIAGDHITLENIGDNRVKVQRALRRRHWDVKVKIVDAA